MNKLSILQPVRSEVLKPEEIVRLSPSDRRNIRRSRIVPPQLGKRGDWGGLYVEYRSPVRKPMRDTYQPNFGKF